MNADSAHTTTRDRLSLRRSRRGRGGLLGDGKLSLQTLLSKFGGVVGCSGHDVPRFPVWRRRNAAGLHTAAFKPERLFLISGRCPWEQRRRRGEKGQRGPAVHRTANTAPSRLARRCAWAQRDARSVQQEAGHSLHACVVGEGEMMQRRWDSLGLPSRSFSFVRHFRAPDCACHHAAQAAAG